MPISPGSRLGPYEVLSFVGAGGMGEVYRARDSRLGREVAIKVLRADHLADETRRRRFTQEARTASALNHPNIATIFDIASAEGTDFIVMEYVAGKPLSALIRPGMRLAEALRVAIAVADALDRAHAAGIVHRDLKPANVVVGHDGTVKVLDFGLAKLVEPEEVRSEHETASEESNSNPLSWPGSIAGTPGYMSPEQATGGKLDARSDIFSFGSVLYEMVTGRRAFHGDSPADTLAKVVRDQPKAPTELVAGVPRELERLVLRCLQKEPERRFQHMADVKVELQEIKDDPESVPSTSRMRARRRRFGWLAAGVACALLLTTAAWLRRRPARDTALPPPRVLPFTTTQGDEWTPALSPDGEQVAFSWEGEAHADGATPNRDIWLKLMGGSETRRLTTDPAADSFPSWSPDGRQIAFIRSTGPYHPYLFQQQRTGEIHLVSPLGGSARRLGDFPAAVSQLAWSPNGRWLAAGLVTSDQQARGLYLIPVQGGAPVAMTAPAPTAFDGHPAFSPDGRRLAYASCVGVGFPPCDVYVVDLGVDFLPTAPPRRLTRQTAHVLGLAWTRDGRSVVYGGERVLDAYLWRVGPEGNGSPERVELAGGGALFPATAVSRDRLVFARDLTNPDIYRFEAGRPPRAVMASTSADYGPCFSPDGRRIAFESGRSGEVREIWLADADGSNPVQLTRGPGDHQGSPRWSPDGRRIVFNSLGEDGYYDVWTIDVSGGLPRRVTHGPLTEGAASWSRDGRWIYYRGDAPDGRSRDMWRIPDAGGAAERVTHHGAVLVARESADGQTLFYTEREGTSPIFSQPLGGGPEQQVVDCVQSRSLADGPDGMYYLGCPAGLRESRLYRLDSATGRSRLLGTVETGGAVMSGLAVSPDGKTILFTRTVGSGGDLMMIENFR